MILIADNHLGVYAPQFIAESGLLEAGGINKSDVCVLTNGPEDEFYWEVWDVVFNEFKTSKGEILWVTENGDVFLAYPEEIEW